MDNTDALKVGAAVAGGYLLGRTKKARAVVSLALWATGNHYRVRDVARDGAARLAQSPEVSKMTSELAGPLLEASRRAALAVVQAQAQRLTQDLQDRTSALTDVGESLLQPDAQGDADEQPADEPDEQPADEPDERAGASADEPDEDERAEEEPASPRRSRSTARSAPAATRRRTQGGSTGTGARRTGSSGSSRSGSRQSASSQSGSRTASSRGGGSSSRRSTTSAQTRSASSRRSR